MRGLVARLAVRVRARSFASSLLDLAGLSAVVYGVYTVSPAAGWIAGGLSAIVLSLTLDRKRA